MWKTKTTTQSLSDLSTKQQTSEILSENITSDVMLIYQKWQHWYPVLSPRLDFGDSAALPILRWSA